MLDYTTLYGGVQSAQYLLRLDPAGWYVRAENAETGSEFSLIADAIKIPNGYNIATSWITKGLNGE